MVTSGVVTRRNLETVEINGLTTVGTIGTTAIGESNETEEVIVAIAMVRGICRRIPRISKRICPRDSRSAS